MRNLLSPALWRKTIKPMCFHSCLSVALAIAILMIPPADAAAPVNSTTSTGAMSSKASAAKLKKLFVHCKKPKTEAACEDGLWRFADATGDNVLTRAEISRFLRLTSVAEGWIQNDGGAGNDFIVWTILGPIAANLILANFDFDGDDRLSRREMYMNFGEGEARQALGEIMESGKTLLAAAMMQALESPLKGVLSPSPPKGALAPQPAPEAKPKARAKPASPLTRRERAALTRQIAQCWRTPHGFTNDDMKGFAVALRLTIARDGVVESATIPDPASKSSSDAYRAFATSARDAALNAACQPVKLPVAKYSAWRRLTIQFKPNIVRFE